MRNFLKDQSGNTAVFFAVSCFAALSAIGMALDYSQIRSMQTVLQGQVDAAVLALAKSDATTLLDRQSLVTAAMEQNGFEVTQFQPQFEITANNEVRVWATRIYNPVIMGLFGKKTVRINAEAESLLFQERQAEVVMVLDVTGSMGGSKIEGLKGAANALVDTISSQGGANSKLALVPFSNYVNISPDFVSQNPYWLLLPQKLIKKSSSENRFWNGCVGSRDRPLNITDGGYGTRIPAMLNETCANPIVPLTTDYSNLTSKINSLSANGATYMPAGIAWGQRVLSYEQPFAQGAKPDKNVSKIMIVMTDGENTLYLSGEEHVWASQSETYKLDATNKDTLLACRRAKGDGTEIYTIAFEVTSADTKGLLRECATTPAHYNDARDSVELQQIFRNIGSEILNVRLTR
ncbi:vWA domain-containing protein [Robiginitomaculum antarcticum]|uniref:vWA domain-containing protein n=1 Tax=Robiginitomaculum antarcticum TaxID=437507 RepID=UPI00036ED0F8|nr:VWA domain-containing protein [Robiginitomaculum antarcticum]